MVLDSQLHVDIKIVVRKKVLMLELFCSVLLCITSTTQHLASFFACTFFHSNFLPILEGDILWITNYDYDKHLSIDSWVKSGL